MTSLTWSTRSFPLRFSRPLRASRLGKQQASLVSASMGSGLYLLIMVDAPDQSRLVRGEVFMKGFGKRAMNRIVAPWSMPKWCFGACRGRGVPQALFIVKACAQEVAGHSWMFPRPSAPYSSGPSWHFFVPTGMPRCYVVRRTTGWHTATHSPILFAPLMADHFDAICARWEAAGVLPAFRVGVAALWGLWFIDDAICFLRNSAQFLRLRLPWSRCWLALAFP